MYYRIDKFAVPAESRAEFLERVYATHRFLREQNGFVRDHLLQQQTPKGVNIITIAEWQNADVAKSVGEAMKRHYEAIGFNVRDFIERLGVTAEFGAYEPTA